MLLPQYISIYARVCGAREEGKEIPTFKGTTFLLGYTDALREYGGDKIIRWHWQRFKERSNLQLALMPGGSELVLYNYDQYIVHALNVLTAFVLMTDSDKRVIH